MQILVAMIREVDGHNSEVKHIGLAHGLSLRNQEKEELRMSHWDFGLSNREMMKLLLK